MWGEVCYECGGPYAVGHHKCKGQNIGKERYVPVNHHTDVNKVIEKYEKEIRELKKENKELKKELDYFKSKYKKVIRWQ